MSTEAKTIGIIGGKGDMGRLFKSLFQKSGFKIIASDRKTKLNNIDVVKKAKICILAIPIDQTKSLLDEVSPYLSSSHLLIELSSTKEMVVLLLRKTKARVLSIHPLCSRSSFVLGQKLLFTPIRINQTTANYFKRILSNQGFQIIDLSLKQHEHLMAISQGIVHFLMLCLGKTIAQSDYAFKKLREISTPSFELLLMLTGRIYNQKSNLYRNIQFYNPYLPKLLVTFFKSLNTLRDIILKKNQTSFDQFFSIGNLYFTKQSSEINFFTDQVIKNCGAQNLNSPSFKSEISIQSNSKIEVNTIALLGPAFTFSDIACDKWIRNNPNQTLSETKKIYCQSIKQIFAHIRANSTSYAFIPLENTLDGSIQESLDQLFEEDFKIIEEINLPIHHCLAISPKNKKENVLKIISHSKALRQCGSYLERTFPDCQLIEVESTAKAMKELARRNNNHVAVIGSEIAAKYYKLKIIQRNIEDHTENKTTFAIITSDNHLIVRFSPRMKTSIAFYFGSNRSGQLYGIFKEFALARINLTKIESRPSKKEHGDYIFYLDFEGDLNNHKISHILQKISPKVAKLKILGSYPYEP